MKEPIFEEFGNGFKVTVFRRQIDLQNLVDKEQKLDLSSLQQLISNQKYNEPTTRNIVSVYNAIEANQVFSAKDIVGILGCSPSTAGEIMHKLKTIQVVVPVKGYGNEKYRFVYKSEL